ncbi:hypothetical protein DCC85_21350 [Paenibacillus sp. CAA11]|uniref:hypothetical protein n=1 Tax=Paenibacillus sp. CAA11 TaxID=1532905 RepID=UPI000D353B76|nr:hypothetical protein [Paenibacillus sp. CAA11]AWB46464.1 hypothetical protein DCC85_21350 [Paenibacillus sp. CAA11]
MKKKALLYTILVCLPLLLSTCSKSDTNAKAPVGIDLPPNRYGKTLGYIAPRNAVEQFIARRMSGEHGVYTNYLDTDQTSAAATGHEVLSESAGLLMRYDVLAGRREAFGKDWALARKTFDQNTGFSYRYSPKQDKRYTVNAAVDDLRIIRALYEADYVWPKAGYGNEADGYGKRFYEHNVKDSYMYDFYDDQYRMTGPSITLCYIDLRTLGMLDLEQDAKDKLYSNMLNIVRGGYLSDAFPLYETRYNYDAKAYSSDHIHTVESMLTILALAEVGQQQEASISFIKEQVKSGALYGEYTKKGQPTTDVQSTAIYAIAAMIGSVLSDQELYEDSIRRMSAYQLQDMGSPLDGAFADGKTQQAYSFDNLMALLAYTY